jgi:uroporphyrinogen decarboxylase
MPDIINKRDLMLNLLSKNQPLQYIPAAFFIHFDPSCHFGQAAANKHIEYFRHTDMDFVKIQYERKYPLLEKIRKPEDWAQMPCYSLDFYEPELDVIKRIIQTAKSEALIIVTLYSPFMCAVHSASRDILTRHMDEDAESVRKGMEIITDSLMLFVKACIQLGVDGFYASTQGGEIGRFQNPQIFTEFIKPYDLVLMDEINRSCVFNILHVCDYHSPYSDLSPYVDYPGHVVNCNPLLASERLSWREVESMFNRPCMGGLDRHGVIASGSPTQIEESVNQVLQEATEPFVLGADCTLPNNINWENIRTAVAAAHHFQKG